MVVCLLRLYILLSYTGRGLCDGLFTRPEESYCVSCTFDHRNPKRGPMFQLGTKEKLINLKGKLCQSRLRFRDPATSFPETGDEIDSSTTGLIHKVQRGVINKSVRTH
jgi:hypothetical protein